jgi:hypothetical protein
MYELKKKMHLILEIFFFIIVSFSMNGLQSLLTHKNGLVNYDMINYVSEI